MSQTINVDITPNNFQPTLNYSQGDVGRTFSIKIVSQYGDTLPAGATVKIQATKPSGFGFDVTADSVTDNVATFTTTAEMTDEWGRFPAQLDVTKDAVTIFSAKFLMVGAKNTHPEGTTDGSQGTIIPELTLLVERVEAAASSVLDMTVNATTLSAGSLATYSYDEDTNTATFGIPQGEAGAGAAGVTASAYSASRTYAVGEYVIHNNNLYRCTTAITTAEAFTAAHWTQVVLGDDVTDLKSDSVQDKNAIDTLSDFCRNLFNGNYALGYAVLTNGVFQATANCVTAVLPCEGGETYFIRVGTPANRFIVAWSTSLFPAGQSVNVITPASTETSGDYKVTVPSSAKSLLIYVSNQNETPDLYVGKGEAMEMIPYANPFRTNYLGDYADSIALRVQDNEQQKVAYNLFDGNYIKDIGLHIYIADTTMIYSNLTGMRSGIVPIKPNTNYYVRVFGTHGRFRIATSANYPTLGDKLDYIYSDNASGYWSFTSGDSDYWMIFTVSITSQEPNVQVIEGYDALDFIGYGNNIAVPLEKVITNKARQLSNNLSSAFRINLFDGEYIDRQGLVYVDGELLYLPNYDNQQTAIVPVKPNTHYYIRTFDGHNRFRVGTSADIPSFGSEATYVYSGTVENLPIYYDFTTDANARWMVITVTNQGETPRMHIVEGEDVVTFLGYDTMKGNGTGEKVSYHFLDDISGVFDADTVPTAIDASTTKITNIYSIYDSIVSDHSDYVTKSVLGTVSTEELEMRKYVFNTMQIQNDSSYSLKKPKLLFIAGIHGYEQGSAYCLARVMKQLADGTDSISKFIRNNVEVIVVPVANPYGYNHNQRKNENGVDLNRNFPAGWSASGTPSDDYYGGASAGGEEETQILMSLLEDNTDSYYVVDFHNIANGYPLMYLYSDEQTQFCNSLFVTLTNKWNSQYSGFPTNRLLGYCKTGVNACFARQAIAMDMNSFVAEAPWVMPVVGSRQYDIPTLTTGCDVFGNIIAMIAKSMLK